MQESSKKFYRYRGNLKDWNDKRIESEIGNQIALIHPREFEGEGITNDNLEQTHKKFDEYPAVTAVLKQLNFKLDTFLQYVRSSSLTLTIHEFLTHQEGNRHIILKSPLDTLLLADKFQIHCGEHLTIQENENIDKLKKLCFMMGIFNQQFQNWCACFTDTPFSDFHWENYASNREGICIEYKIADERSPDLNHPELVPQKMYYHDNPEEGLVRLIQKEFDDLLFDRISSSTTLTSTIFQQLKRKKYEHENEYRLLHHPFNEYNSIISKRGQENLFLKDINKTGLKISAVYFGKNVNKNCGVIQEIQKIAEDKNFICQW